MENLGGFEVVFMMVLQWFSDGSWKVYDGFTDFLQSEAGGNVQF